MVEDGIVIVIEAAAGKSESEAGELMRTAFHIDSHFVGLENLVRDGQAETHAFADIFGGEERIENFLQILCRDADAIVVSRHHPTFSGGFEINHDFTRITTIRFKSLLDGVDAVLEKIDENLHQLIRIPADRSMVRRGEMERDFLADLMADHSPCSADDFRKIRVTIDGIVVACEFSQIDDNLRNPLHAFTDVFENVFEVLLIRVR